MKTKIFFFLATMMFCCASAFAQSGNNEPLQGDVNEDGIVDVADIAAIIEIIKDQGGEIYYWYVGTTKPTSLSQAQTVTSYPAEQTFTNPSTTEKCYVYVLTNSNKTVNMYDPAMPTTPLTTQIDTSTINGYNITYISNGTEPTRIAKGGSIIIRIS